MNPVQDGVILVTSYSLRLGYPLSTHSLRNKCEAQWGVVGPPLPPSSWRNRNFTSPQGRLEEKPGAWGLSFHQFLASSPLTSQCLGHNPSSESRGSNTKMTENQQPPKRRRAPGCSRRAHSYLPAPIWADPVPHQTKSWWGIPYSPNQKFLCNI